MSAATGLDDRELERLAEEELLREASRGKIRAEIQGPSGWLKCPLPQTNKRFLKTTVKNNVASNNYRSRKLAEKRSISPPRSSSDETKTDSEKSSKSKKKRY